MHQVYDKCRKVLASCNKNKEQRLVAIRYCWLLFKKHAEYDFSYLPSTEWMELYFYYSCFKWKLQLHITLNE